MGIPHDWRRIVDFLFLATTLYVLLRWSARARALRIALGITALYVGVLVARQADLLITAWLLQGAAVISVALLVIVFQPEVRRALTRLDRSLMLEPRRNMGTLDRALAESAFNLAGQGLGALFVVAGQESIDELLEGATIIGADISAPLIEAIFQKTSPLHDGAVIIEGSRISRAGAVLPLTVRPDVPMEYGTRHRAAMGIAERSDAICIVVSEERREVTVMRGMLRIPMKTPQQLADLLDKAVSRPNVPLSARLRGFVFSFWRVKLAALGLASLIWTVVLFDTGSTVRIIEFPIEFQNVPAGLDIHSQSTPALAVELRGRTWLMDSNQLSGLIARFNLSGSDEGTRVLRVSPSILRLPPGISMIHSTPETVSVSLTRRRPPGSTR